MKELLTEIQKFKAWADLEYPNLRPREINGEWETYYDGYGWAMITTLFEKVVKSSRPDSYSDSELSELVYIIARDNECEILADILSNYDEWLLKLCEVSLHLHEPDAKWQLAVRLKDAEDKKQAALLLEKFVQDDDEYVSRRALLELPALLPDKAEAYAEQFWHRDIHGAMQEYQRMAVLTVLNEIHSPLLEEYLKRAKEDGRENLVQYADGIK